MSCLFWIAIDMHYSITIGNSERREFRIAGIPNSGNSEQLKPNHSEFPLFGIRVVCYVNSESGSHHIL